MKNIWHPFTQEKLSDPPCKVVRAQGSKLYLEDGREVIDAVSSWWCNLHGHCHPRIVEAIAKQAEKLDHVLFAGFTHDPAEKLVEKLLPKLPKGLTKFKFSDSGSTAVEIALKISWQYWANQGKQRGSFLAFEGGYHGDTVGAMSVSERYVFTKAFDDLLFDATLIPYPATFSGDDKVEEKEERALGLLREKLKMFPEHYAALIVEPLVQGSGGMRICRPVFLQKVEALCKEAGVLVIYDEVMTGFGRTGEFFAANLAKTNPDILCLAKGLTGGTLPLALTVCTEEIYSAFYSDDLWKTLWHGHTYAANPIGCAAAIASIELLEENPGAYQEMEKKHWHHMKPLMELPNLKNFRVQGTIAAMEVSTTGEQGYLNEISGELRRFFLEKGVLLRPLGNTIYVLPPYCITDEELKQVYEAISLATSPSVLRSV